jgi:hypothetical protein
MVVAGASRDEVRARAGARSRLRRWARRPAPPKPRARGGRHRRLPTRCRDCEAAGARRRASGNARQLATRRRTLRHDSAAREQPRPPRWRAAGSPAPAEAGPRCHRQGRILAGSYDPYDGASELARAYHARNRARGKTGGVERIRVRYRQYATPWYDVLFASREEVARLVEGTGWVASRFVDDGAGYVAVLDLDRNRQVVE